MVSAQDRHRLTPQEYFEWEAQQELRYEYFDDEVFAMAGGSLPHADIALNVASLLRAQLQGRCKVRNSDAKVGITEDGPFTYPDVSVSCDERDRMAQKFSRLTLKLSHQLCSRFTRVARSRILISSCSGRLRLVAETGAAVVIILVRLCDRQKLYRSKGNEATRFASAQKKR